MRTLSVTEGEYYHVCNRGMHKQKIFNNDHDRYRFLFLITHLQSPQTFADISVEVKNFKNTLRQHSVLTEVPNLGKERVVELVAFALMPNHFHLILKESKPGGISKYMQRIQNSFTKYMNIKNATSGHLFQGPYRIVHVEDNEQLLYTSAYVHLNCRELKDYSEKPEKYAWSSYQDYIIENRWKKLLETEMIMDQFASQKEYWDSVKNSGAKEPEEVERLIMSTPSVDRALAPRLIF